VIDRWLADLVVVTHFLFVAFVAIGSLLAVRWPALVWLHAPVVAWSAAIVTIDFTCPLTSLEKLLRRRGGTSSYRGGFVDHYIRDVVYPDELTVHARVIVGLTITAGYLVLVCRHRARRAHALDSADASGEPLSSGASTRDLLRVATTEISSPTATTATTVTRTSTGRNGARRSTPSSPA
jgi:hypothetical protein